MPYELAGLNAMFPLAAAAQLGVPVLDADFIGRGFSSLDTTMLGVSSAQVTLAGVTSGVPFVHWLIFQSLYRIEAICPPISDVRMPPLTTVTRIQTI